MSPTTPILAHSHRGQRSRLFSAILHHSRYCTYSLPGEIADSLAGQTLNHYHDNNDYATHLKPKYRLITRDEIFRWIALRIKFTLSDSGTILSHFNKFCSYTYFRILCYASFLFSLLVSASRLRSAATSLAASSLTVCRSSRLGTERVCPHSNHPIVGHHHPPPMAPTPGR